MSEDNGIDDLEGRRTRATQRSGRVQRKAPDPKRKRKAQPTVSTEDASSEATHEITREDSRETLAPSSPGAVAESAPAGPPALEVDLSDEKALRPAPTTLNVPSSIVERFERALPPRTTHAAMMLDAIRSQAERLPELVVARRPAPRAGDPFPLRALPGESGRPERPGTLRVRPLAAEVEVLDRLVAWVDAEVRQARPGGRKVSRSEVVAAALDAYLPPLSRKSRK